MRLRLLRRWTLSALSGTGVQAHRGDGEQHQVSRRPDRRYVDVTFKINSPGAGSYFPRRVLLLTNSSATFSLPPMLRKCTKKKTRFLLRQAAKAIFEMLNKIHLA